MKKLIACAILLGVLNTASFAGPNDALFASLKNAANSIKATASWQTVGEFKKAAFSFSGKRASVFYDEHNQLIGFSVSIGLDELPAGTTDNIAKRYAGWNITDKIMFIDEFGNTKYYVEVNDGKHILALEANAKGRVYVYADMMPK